MKNSSSPQLVQKQISAHGVVTLTLNDPETRNAMSDQMAEAFHAQITSIKSLPSARLLVLRGAGRAFSGGGHLEMLQQKIQLSAEENRRLMLDFYHAFLSLLELEIPVIAALNGHAIGAALGVALACDIRIATASAKFGVNFVKLGLHPGMATTYFLQRVVGLPRATELLMSGRIISADEAYSIGLISSVHPDTEFEAALERLTTDLLESSPLALGQLKLSLRLASRSTLQEALAREADCQAISYASADFLEGVSAAREKRKPKFT